MMRPRHLLVATMLIGLGACSALRPEPPLDRDAAHRLDRGLAALDGGLYREAFDDLAWVYTHCTGHTRGAEALVALAALELDPRNLAGRPAVGTDLLARVLREPTPPDYVRPMAASAYLMARALGAPAAAPAERGPTAAEAGAAPAEAADSGAARPTPADTAVRVAEARVDLVRAAEVLEPITETSAYGCGAEIAAEGWVAPRLPEMPGPTLVSLLAAAERARDASEGQVATLRQELETTRARLTAVEAELERIRKTLRP